MASVKDLTSFGIRLETCRRIPNEDFEKLVRQGCKPLKGDVLIAKDGATALDTVCEVKKDDEVVLLSSVAILRPNPSIIDSSYLHYYLDSSTTRSYLKGSFISGAAIPRVVLKDLKRASVRVPPRPTQRRIADILSAYDDLIEINQRRIRILENMARGLYREWFVHFRYSGHESILLVDSPLGQIPQGWEVRNVKDIANVTYGCALKSKSFNTEGNGLPVVRIRDIPTGASETFTDEECDAKYHINNGHILVGMDGDFHMCIWSNGLALQNQRVARFESQGEIGNYHLFLALERPIQEFNKAIVGTTVAHLGDMHIKTIQIIWPSSALRQKAKEILEPLSSQIIALKRQTSNLRRTRDLLLPRLLSGQVALADMPPVTA